MDAVTTFGARSEFERALRLVERLRVFEGDRGDLRDALLAVCSGLGVPAEEDV